MKYLFGSIFALYSSNLFASANDWQLSFQNPATDLMQEVIDLHDLILIMMMLLNLFLVNQEKYKKAFQSRWKKLAKI